MNGNEVRRRIFETADWVKQSRHPFIGVSESTHSANANTVHEIGLASRSLLSLNSLRVRTNPPYGRELKGQ